MIDVDKDFEDDMTVTIEESQVDDVNKFDNQKDQELLQAVLAEIDNAEFTSKKDLESAMRYYNADARGDEIDGRSDVQSHDVADMIEALTAQIMPAFESTELAHFDAFSENDEEQVRIESKYVNYTVMQANKGFITIQEVLKNALLMRNGIFKVYMDTKISVKPIGVQGDFEDIDFMLYKEGLAQNQEIYVGEEENTSESDQVVSIVTTIKDLKVESVPPEEFLYAKGWYKVSLEECPFVAHHTELYRYELIDMGHDPKIINDIPPSNSDKVYGTDIRDRVDDVQDYATNQMLDNLDYYEAYYVYDHNEDGYPERLKICIASDRILSIEEVDFHPFAGGLTVLMPNRFRGISTYDQQKDVQDGKTKILRQYTDNINANNNRRLEVEIKNIIDVNDLTDSKPGGIIKSRKIGSIAPVPVDDIGQSCERFLGYWDRIRTNRSGASLDMVSENMSVGGETAHGAERIISSKEQIGALAANTFKETAIKDMFLLVHKTMRSYMQGNKTAKINGEWVTTSPELWQDRINVSIQIGASQGIATKKIAALSSVIERQIKAFSSSQGGILVNHKGVYNAIIDLDRAAGIDNPERYWMNPDSEESKQTIKGNSEASQKASQDQKKLQNIMLQNETIRAQADAKSKQAKAQVDQMRIQLDEMKRMVDEGFKDANFKADMIKHYDNLAMQITSLEAQYNKQITDYSNNHLEVSDGQ